MVRQPSPFSPPFGSWAKWGLISARGAAACQPSATGPGPWVWGGACAAAHVTAAVMARTVGSKIRVVRVIGFLLLLGLPPVGAVPGVEGRGPVGVAPHLQDEPLPAARVESDRQERRLHLEGLVAGCDAFQLVLPVGAALDDQRA